jgi:hypothetical protein
MAVSVIEELVSADCPGERRDITENRGQLGVPAKRIYFRPPHKFNDGELSSKPIARDIYQRSLVFIHLPSLLCGSYLIIRDFTFLHPGRNNAKPLPPFLQCCALGAVALYLQYVPAATN